ncbi:hypothetical protein GCM10009838_17440 [Catenulispora subtropica]|uniref:Uncharacterized protein n=2 Tax=Catenulispora subtropica TaxID=450798 RepID=A0ABN2R171_9ACTN
MAACSSARAGKDAASASSPGSPSATSAPASSPASVSGSTGASAATPASQTSPKAPAATPTTAETPASTTPPRAATGASGLGGCAVAPPDSVWRTRVDHLPVSARSAAYIASIGSAQHVHADFGAGLWDGGPIGIPITLVPNGTPSAHVTFDYADESDKGPYPIPAGAAIEGGPQASGDRHVIALDPATCTDYELYDAHPAGGAWKAGSGAVFALRSDALRPAGWTSADAAGLPILPGLARYDEAATGTIDHALRITVPRSQSAYLWPARHQASSNADPALPPMGLRLRLKASVDISGLPPQARAVAQALKTYGAIVADNGSAWYISGTPDDHWSNDQLQRLGSLAGSDFEAVDESGLRISVDSGAARSG